MDSVSLVLNALTSGAAQGVSDAVKSAYGKLKQLVSAKLSGNKTTAFARG